jgi:hypothetical protein
MPTEVGGSPQGKPGAQPEQRSLPSEQPALSHHGDAANVSGHQDVDPVASKLRTSEFNGVKAERVLPGKIDKVAVIGRSMAKAVLPYAEGLRGKYDVETFGGDKISPAAQAEWENLKKQYAPAYIPDEAVVKSLLFQENQAWATKLRDQGYRVVDVGNPNNERPSPFYEMEKRILFGGGSTAGAKR